MIVDIVLLYVLGFSVVVGVCLIKNVIRICMMYVPNKQNTQTVPV